MSRVCGVDSTNPESYTEGEIKARFQNDEVERYLRDFIPGFENAWRDRWLRSWVSAKAVSSRENMS